MVSMNAFVVVQSLNVVSPSTSATTTLYWSVHVTLGSSFATEDVSRDVQRNADKAGNNAAITDKDLEGNAKSASRDARSKVNNIVDKAQNAAEDAGDSIKKNFNKATDIAQNNGKDVQRKAENVGNSACDTACNMKRCREGC